MRFIKAVGVYTSAHLQQKCSLLVSKGAHWGSPEAGGLGMGRRPMAHSHTHLWQYWHRQRHHSFHRQHFRHHPRRRHRASSRGDTSCHLDSKNDDN